MVLNLRPQGFGIVYGFLQKIVKLVSIDTISDPLKAPWEDKKRIYSGNLAPKGRVTLKEKPPTNNSIYQYRLDGQ